MTLRDLRAGVYRHYRGGYYLVEGYARHSETDEVYVLYTPLYVRAGPRKCVRPVELFFGPVPEVCPHCDRSHAGIGTEERADGWYCGVCRRTYVPSVERFVYLGPEILGTEAYSNGE